MSDVAIARGGVDRARILAWLRDYGVYAAIVLLVAIATILSPSFLSAGNLRVQAFQLVPTLLVSLGMAMVIATEGVDLSVGAVIALAASLVPLYLGYNAYIAIAVCIVGGIVAGAISGSMVALAKVQPIVATLALMIGLRGLAVIFNGNQAKPVSDPTFDAIGLNSVAGVPIMLIVAVVAVLIVLFVMRRTTFGRQLVAVGDNRAASTLAGLPVRRVLLTVYIVSGVLAALAGVMLVGHGAEADPAKQGLNIELAAITAVVVGGTPLTGGRIRVLGTVAGAVFMQLLSATLIQHNVRDSFAQMAEAVIICLAVYAARDRSGR